MARHSLNWAAHDRRSHRDWADWERLLAPTDIAVPAVALRCLAAIVLVLASLSPALSRAGTSLYTGQVPVNSQADGERAEALKSALAQVVVKLSGDSTAPTRPGVAKAVASAERYVQQYQYTQDVTTDAGQSQARLTLVAQFDHDAVDQLMRDLGLVHGGGDAAQPAAEVQSGTYRVWVSGVNSAEDYARLIGSLSRNELVRSVRAEQARGDGVQLKLDVNGPLSRLLESLGLGPVHVLNAKPPVDGVDALLGMQQP
jgi:hypothetical protein